MSYKHGAYGEITSSKVTDAKQGDVVAAYIGTAPINLIRGYAEKNLINMPIKVANMSDTQSKLGYSHDWEAYTLCEAFAEHFDNTVENAGPIYVVNVLDPDTHRKAEKTTKELSFVNKRTEFESSDIILDTFAIADKTEGVDYSLEYNFAKGTVVVRLLKEEAAAAVQCSYNTIDKSKVEEGDIIAINIPAHTIELQVSDEVLAERRAKWVCPEPRIKTGYLSRYAKLVSSADRGAVLE